MTSDELYQIDQKATSIYTEPTNIEGTFTDGYLMKRPGLVGDDTNMEFSIKTMNSIPQEGYITLQFPDEALQIPLDGTVECLLKAPIY